MTGAGNPPLAFAIAWASVLPVVLMKAATRSGLLAGFVHAFYFTYFGGAPVFGAFAWLVIGGTLATHAGRERKRAFGVAQEKGGRRSARHVIANAGAALLWLIVGMTAYWVMFFRYGEPHGPGVSPHDALFEAFAVAAAASLAGSLADTVSGELGMLTKSTPRMLLFGRVVPRGTDGGMTWGGTAWGAAFAVAVGATTWACGFRLHAAVVVAVAGIMGTWFDSALGATLERRGWLNNETTNFTASALAGAAAFVMERSA